MTTNDLTPGETVNAYRRRHNLPEPPAQRNDDITDRLAGSLAHALSLFTEPHPTDPGTRTGWVENRIITAWRSAYADWAALHEPGKPAVRKIAHAMPMNAGTCEHCGTPITFNMAAGICRHTTATDCTDPYPAQEA